MKNVFIFSLFICVAITGKVQAADSCYSHFSYTAVFNQNIQFTNSSYSSDSSAKANYTWHFGDGDTSIDSDPTHHYSSPGQYYVCLYLASKGRCQAHFCDSVYVQGDSSLCHISFDWYREGHHDYLFISHVPLDSSAIFSWNFGDGSPVSHEINPYHSFAAADTYLVCLNYTSAHCSSHACADLRVLPDSAYCSAEFSVMQIGEVVYFSPFTDSLYHGGDSMTHFLWTFGDGDSSYSAFPTHIYARDTVYTVCLTISDSTCTDTKCQSIYYTNNDTTGGGGGPCSALFSVSNADSLKNTIWLYDLSTGARTYLWSFGDSSFSHAEFPSHTYAGSGPYTVCLTITCDSGTSMYCSSVSLGDSMNSHFAVRRMILNVRPAQTTKVSPIASLRMNVKIVPSPASDFIHIVLPPLMKSLNTLKVYNLYGQEVINQVISALPQSSFIVDIRKLPAGQYIIELEGKSSVAVGRFVKD